MAREDGESGRLGRRSTLVRGGTLAVVALGASGLSAEAAESGSQAAVACVLSIGDDRRPVLRP